MDMSNIRTAEPSWHYEHHSKTNIVVNDPVAVIYNEGQWRINKLSPLYNLQFDAVKLKQYGLKITQAVVGAAEANSIIKYTVNFETLPHLKYCEEDSDGLLISISSTQENNNKTKVAFTGILMSWGVSSKLRGATHLPYMLERGEQKLAAAVKTVLKTIFDCHIVQICFTQHQLLQLGLNFLDHDTSRDLDQFGLIFRTAQVDTKDKLQISFDLKDMKIIWNGVKEEATKTSELVNLAYQILQNQILHMITLDIISFDLYEVILPSAEVKSNGTVKMKTPEIVNCVFTLLNEICDIHSTKDL